MSQVQVVLHGYLGNDPVQRMAGEVPVTNFRLASTPGWFDRQKGQWVNGETQWYTVNCWRSLAENARTSLRRGDPVVVSGRLVHSNYVNKDGVLVTTQEIEADFVGPDLNRCRTRQLVDREQVDNDERPGAPASSADILASVVNDVRDADSEVGALVAS